MGTLLSVVGVLGETLGAVVLGIACAVSATNDGVGVGRPDGQPAGAWCTPAVTAPAAPAPATDR